MKVALFIPCYVNQLYPSVAISTLRILEAHQLDVEYPLSQTCCGQPMANSGFEHLTADCNALFLKNFQHFDCVVCPSGSCVLHVKEHLKVKGAAQECLALRNKVFELAEFLVDVLKISAMPGSFPFKVGIHQSCHGQRGLKISQMSELVAPAFSKTETLLRMMKGIKLIDLDRQDECCGFGGTFCVAEEAVSVKMGKDRVYDHTTRGAEYITGNDMSCLMHLEGILRRQKSKVKTIHLADILNAGMNGNEI